MNAYYVKDTYNYGVTGIVLTNKTQKEVQKIIDEAILKNEDYRYNNVLDAFKENGITFIHNEDIKDVEW